MIVLALSMMLVGCGGDDGDDEKTETPTNNPGDNPGGGGNYSNYAGTYSGTVWVYTDEERTNGITKTATATISGNTFKIKGEGVDVVFTLSGSPVEESGDEYKIHIVGISDGGPEARATFQISPVRMAYLDSAVRDGIDYEFTGVLE